MKAKLKHASGQYVLIVDTSPMNGQYYYDKITQSIGKADNIKYDYMGYPNLSAIIAAENLKGVKGIKVDFKRFMSISDEEFISFIDTELEVTEEEEYWIVRL